MPSRPVWHCLKLQAAVASCTRGPARTTQRGRGDHTGRHGHVFQAAAGQSDGPLAAAFLSAPWRPPCLMPGKRSAASLLGALGSLRASRRPDGLEASCLSEPAREAVRPSRPPAVTGHAARVEPMLGVSASHVMSSKQGERHETSNTSRIVPKIHSLIS